MDRPALLTQVSIAPNSSNAASPRRSTAFSSETSVGTATTRPPFARISSAALLRSVSLRAAITTRAPRLAAIRAVARPIPLEAPVMTMTWSLRALGLRFFMRDPQATAAPYDIVDSYTAMKYIRLFLTLVCCAIATISGAQEPSSTAAKDKDKDQSEALPT